MSELAKTKGKKLTRQEMIDSRVLFFNGVPFTKSNYDAYRSLGYGDGTTWDDLVIAISPHLATNEAFRSMYPDNPV